MWTGGEGGLLPIYMGDGEGGRMEGGGEGMEGVITSQPPLRVHNSLGCLSLTLSHVAVVGPEGLMWFSCDDKYVR